MSSFEQVIRGGGVVLFPSDTVYGLACDPLNAEAIGRLYALKGRAPAKASAVMFFDLAAALASLPALGSRTRTAVGSLLPGGVTLLLENQERLWPLACGEDPDTLGLRVINVPALRGVAIPVLQSSANHAGGSDSRRLEDVPGPIRAAVDLVVDGGELPGTSSTVVDLRRYERAGIDGVRILRHGAVPEAEVVAALDRDFHFNPVTYADEIRVDLPNYDRFQSEVVAASGEGARRILELGAGTGETTRRLLEHHPDAVLTGVDESSAMLAAASATLPADRVELLVARLQDPLPEGPFDLVVSALCVHHLDAAEKADLFRRIGTVLAAGGRVVIGDVVVPDDPADASTEMTPGYDKPSRVDEQLEWLRNAGFEARIGWMHGDLAVLVATSRT